MSTTFPARTLRALILLIFMRFPEFRLALSEENRARAIAIPVPGNGRRIFPRISECKNEEN
jgi:hypothetical protein